MSVSLVEALWVAITLSTFVLTFGAFLDARADRTAVRLLNGNARELAASGIVRREAIRTVVQAFLLALAVPGLFSARDTPVSFGVVVLMVVAVLLLLASLFDARDRKAMTILVAAELLIERNDAFTRLEAQIAENTQISQQASDHADLAYKEANSVNEKIAAQGVVLVDQGKAIAAQGAVSDEATARVEATVDDTAEKVTDIHEATVKP